MDKQFTRQQYNGFLLAILSNYMENHPEVRFGQALYNLKLVHRKPDSLEIQDPFYEEPSETLKRMITCHGDSEGTD